MSRAETPTARAASPIKPIDRNRNTQSMAHSQNGRDLHSTQTFSIKSAERTRARAVSARGFLNERYNDADSPERGFFHGNPHLTSDHTHAHQKKTTRTRAHTHSLPLSHARSSTNLSGSVTIEASGSCATDPLCTTEPSLPPLLVPPGRGGTSDRINSRQGQRGAADVIYHITPMTSPVCGDQEGNSKHLQL